MLRRSIFRIWKLKLALQIKSRRDDINFDVFLSRRMNGEKENG